MPGYLDDLLRMLDQAQAPQGVTRARVTPSRAGMDMEAEALRQAMAAPVWENDLMAMDDVLAALKAKHEAAIASFYDAAPQDVGQFEEPFRVIPDMTFPNDPPYSQVLTPYRLQTTGVPVPVTRDNPMAYGNNMQMPAQEMEPSNMDIRSLLAALAGAGGGFAAGRLTAPQHTMPDGTVMPGSADEMYSEPVPSMPQEPEDLTNGQRVPGSMRMPMPPPYQTPPQLQRLNNLRMP